MKQAYVVTEGKSDVELLKKVLPKSIVKDVEFIAGSGRYSAQSLTRSILAVKQLPTAIVADSDTEDESTIQEQKDFLRESLHQASAGIQFEIFLAVPEIEIVFFQEPTLLEKLAHQNFSNIEWEMAKSHPKEFLKKHVKNSGALLKNLDNQAIEVIRRHPLVSGLSQFLSSVIDEGK